MYCGENGRRGLSALGLADEGAGSAGAGYSMGTAASRLPVPVRSLKSVRTHGLARATSITQRRQSAARHLVRPCARWAKTQYTVEESGKPHAQSTRNGGPWLPYICSAFNLFGIDETLVRMKTEPTIIEATLDQIEAFVYEFSRRMLEATRGLVDIFYFGDDFATQRSMLLLAQGLAALPQIPLPAAVRTGEVLRAVCLVSQLRHLSPGAVGPD